MDELKEYFCSVLSNGRTVIYAITSNEKWDTPCFAEIKEPKMTIDFWPLTIFAASDTINPIDDDHILTTYVANLDVQKAYTDFLKIYKEQMQNVDRNKMH